MSSIDARYKISVAVEVDFVTVDHEMLEAGDVGSAVKTESLGVLRTGTEVSARLLLDAEAAAEYLREALHRDNFEPAIEKIINRIVDDAEDRINVEESEPS